MENLLTRHRINQENISKGILPRPKGRPQTRTLTNEQQELEIKRLKTENELLQPFLVAAGRMRELALNTRPLQVSGRALAAQA